MKRLMDITLNHAPAKGIIGICKVADVASHYVIENAPSIKWDTGYRAASSREMGHSRRPIHESRTFSR
ncbi:hypothetical protein EVAR_68668_1 [Eumeta japonica]|uniref:Uncharacterized protein n=1 Tax=Eumeta variegata TaxID=151549 RepID=A0A4C2A3M7_EUMVA|nr:hypothetical protein EVAR_68668_1 [Eumeta japonica]